MAADQIAQLRRRAELVARARRFFDARDVLEVDTPLAIMKSICEVEAA